MSATPLRSSRRVLLLGAAGAALAACSGSQDSPSRSSTGSTTRASTAAEEAAIFDLSFSITDRSRPFALVAPGFAAVDSGPQSRTGLELSDDGPPAPWAAVELRVRTGGGGAGTAVAGLATAEGDQVLVRWSADTNSVSLRVRTGGHTRVLRRQAVDPVTADEVGLAFALCENQVTALMDTGDGWQPVLTERTKVAALVDLRREDVLGDYRYAWGGDLASVRAGVFGMTGLRDGHLVQHADGTPYLRDGRYHFTWTSAGLGFFQQAHWSVWSLDPAEPTEMRLEAHLFSRRDGLLVGDHAGQLVRDGDRWLVATSSWGDFEPGQIHVRHTSTTDDLLRGVHVLDTEPTPLPTEVGSWDPAITRIDDTWYVAFVESPSQDPFDFHPALARTTAADWTDELAPVAAATDLHQCEGPILATVEEQTWLLASDKDGAAYPVFDLEGRRVGRLDAPYPTNIPHPQLVPDPAGGWWMVTFEGTQFAEPVMGYGGHGDVVVMHSE